MPDIINADYQVVQEKPLEMICVEIKTIEAQTCNAIISGVVLIGQKLQEAKSRVGHGNWKEWLNANLNYSERQAQKYIQISKEYGNENSAYSNPQICADLSISKAYSLLSLPESEVESFVEEHDIQDMTVAQLEAEIKEWKSKATDADAALIEEKSKNEELQKAIEEGEARRMELAKEISEMEEHAADAQEIEKLKKQLEKARSKVKKAEEALATEKANVQGKIDAAVNSKSDELKKAAEIEQQRNIRQLEINLKYADEEVQNLRKKLEQSGSEEIAVFKVKSNQLQQDFREMEQAIQSMVSKDTVQAERMKEALRKVMENLMSKLEV